MTRVCSAVQSWRHGKEMTVYLRQRAWHWATRGNYALAADYVIRLLNKHPRDAEALALGAVCARYTRQDTFFDKCVEAQRRLCFVKDVADACQLIQPASHSEEVRTWLASHPSAHRVRCGTSAESLTSGSGNEGALREPASVTTEGDDSIKDAARAYEEDDADERVCVSETEALEETDARVRQACACVHAGGSGAHTDNRRRCSRDCVAVTGAAELLSPRGTSDGRGLYASRALRCRNVILMDAPTLVQTHDRTRYCAHCLGPLHANDPLSTRTTATRKDVSGNSTTNIDSDTLLTVSCPHCSQEHYCSELCRSQAWEQYHVCTCVARNPDYAAWSESMWQHPESSSTDATSTRRASRTEPTAVAVVSHTLQHAEPTADAAAASSSSSAAALACLLVAKACAMSAVQQVYPLHLPGLAHLRGMAEYSRTTALSEIGGMSVALAAALRQTHLFMEEMVSLFAVLQSNEVTVRGGVALYPVLSLLNHSCEPNCVISTAGPAGRRQLIACRDIRNGEQLLVDYHACVGTALSYEDRKRLCAQRGFECFCPRCVRRQ